jgi:dolichol-phosphate mannosyltransferase
MRPDHNFIKKNDLQSRTNITLSIVCTVYRSEIIVPDLVSKISTECTKLSQDFEIILVDDGSPDNSWIEIEKICLSNCNIIGIKLGRNVGQQLAVTAGLRHTSGKFTIVMDGDLQNPPSAIPKIFSKLQRGFDIVYTTSLSRNSIGNSFSSMLFWWIMNKFFKERLIPNQLMMRGMSSKYLKIFNCYDEYIRNVVGITHDIGLNYDIIEVQNGKRHSGKSNYNFFKRMDVMLDLVLLITNRPLTYLIYGACIAVLSSTAFGVLTLINFTRFPEMPSGYPTLVFLISFFGSFTLLVLGVIGRYLANIYTEVRNRPLFSIDKIINS